MIVKALSHELQRQRVLVPGGFLDLGPLVLEPNLNLVLVQLQFVGQVLAALLVQVAVLVELALESRQLLGRERSPRPLLLGAARLGPGRPLLLHPATTRPCHRPTKKSLLLLIRTKKKFFFLTVYNLMEVES